MGPLLGTRRLLGTSLGPAPLLPNDQYLPGSSPRAEQQCPTGAVFEFSTRGTNTDEPLRTLPTALLHTDEGRVLHGQGQIIHINHEGPTARQDRPFSLL